MTAVLVVTIDVEQVKQGHNGQHVPRNVQISVIITHARLGRLSRLRVLSSGFRGTEYPSQPSREKEQCPISLLIRKNEVG